MPKPYAMSYGMCCPAASAAQRQAQMSGSEVLATARTLLSSHHSDEQVPEHVERCAHAFITALTQLLQQAQPSAASSEMDEWAAVVDEALTVCYSFDTLITAVLHFWNVATTWLLGPHDCNLEALLQGQVESQWALRVCMATLLHTFVQATAVTTCMAWSCSHLIAVSMLLLASGGPTTAARQRALGAAHGLLEVMTHGPLTRFSSACDRCGPLFKPSDYPTRAAKAGHGATAAANKPPDVPSKPLSVQAYQLFLWLLQHPVLDDCNASDWEDTWHGSATMGLLAHAVASLGGSPAQLSACVLATLRDLVPYGSNATALDGYNVPPDDRASQVEVWLRSAGARRVLTTLAAAPGVASLMVALLGVTRGNEDTRIGAAVLDLVPLMWRTQDGLRAPARVAALVDVLRPESNMRADIHATALQRILEAVDTFLTANSPSQPPLALPLAAPAQLWSDYTAGVLLFAATHDPSARVRRLAVRVLPSMLRTGEQESVVSHALDVCVLKIRDRDASVRAAAVASLLPQLPCLAQQACPAAQRTIAALRAVLELPD